jgi:hypothetical protein
MYIKHNFIRTGMQITIPSIRSGIAKVSNEVLPILVTAWSGLTSGVWSGAYQALTVSVLGTYYRVSMVSVTSGTLPDGIIDNNDGSFTNNTGRPLKIIDRISLFGYFPSGNTTHLSLGSDSGGSDAVILANSGMWRGTAGTLSGAICLTTHCTYEWVDGVTIFPMVLNNTAGNNYNMGSLKHSFEIIGEVVG